MISESHNQLDQTLGALADPTRRAILQKLSEGDARVTELAKPFPVSLNAVSKHIKILERAQLVKRRREGREHLLSLNLDALEGATAWLNTQKALWARRLDALEDLLVEEGETKK